MKEKQLILAYSDIFEPLGYIERSVANRTGLLHGCAQVWIINSLNGGNVIFQKRSSNKSISPSKFDVSASGHVEGDDLSIDTAVRETYEELGIVINKSNLLYAGRRFDFYKKDDIISRIFADVYFIIDETDLFAYRIDKNELEALVQVPIKDGFRLFSNDTNTLECRGIEFTSDSYELQPKTYNLSTEHFIPRYDFYYLKVFLMAEKILMGQKSIAI